MVHSQQIISQSPAETAAVGQALATELKAAKGERDKATLICLYGDLGSGKTTFTQGFAKGLGIKSRLLSPTFIIVRRYEIPEISQFLYHVDLYRLNQPEDLADLGLAEIFAQAGTYVVIEWAEKLGTYMPHKRLDIRFSVLSDGSHEINFNQL